MFGEYIKYIRKTRNLTQKDLAKKLFIAPCTLSHYENGSRMIPNQIFTRALKICNYKIQIIDCETGKNITKEELKRVTVEI